MNKRKISLGPTVEAQDRAMGRLLGRYHERHGVVVDLECCGNCGDILDDSRDDMESLRCADCRKWEE